MLIPRRFGILVRVVNPLALALISAGKNRFNKSRFVQQKIIKVDPKLEMIQFGLCFFEKYCML